jgi:hypothetical protein
MEKAMSEAEAAWQDLQGSDIETYAPTLNLRQIFEDFGKESVTIIVREWAKVVGWTHEVKGAMATMVMLVEYEGEPSSIWLSAESLRRSMMAIYQTIGENIVGQTIVITRRLYDSKEWGPKTVAYNCHVLLPEDDSQTELDV